MNEICPRATVVFMSPMVTIRGLSVASKGDLRSFVFQVWYGGIYYSDFSSLESRLPVVVGDEVPRLLDAHKNRPDGAVEPQDSCRALHVAAEPLVSGLHGRVEHRVRRRDLADLLFWSLVLVGDLDEAALLGVRRARIALVVAEIFERVARREDFALVLVDENRPDAGLIPVRREFSVLLDGVLHESFVVPRRERGVVLF